MSHEQHKLFTKALSLLRNNNPAGAIEACAKGLEKYPEDGNLLCVAARASLAQRDVASAKLRVEKALQLYPEFALGHELLGDVLLVEGKFQDALAAYQRCSQISADQPAVAQKTAKTKQLIEQAADAAEPFAGGRVPRGKMAFAGKIREAEEYERGGDRDKAEAIYRTILKADPDHIEASRLLAGIAAGHEQFREAQVFLRRALELAPDYVRAWVDLANVQRQLEDFDAAIESATKVMELAPDKAESYMLYASIVGAADRHDEAIEFYEKAIALAPGKAGALCSIAHHLKTVGRQEDAIDSYRACIAIQNNHSEAYWSLANLKTFRFEKSEVEAMQNLLDGDDLVDESRAQIHNALGLQHEAIKDFDQAYWHFEQCNLVRRKAEYYDPVDTESTHDRVIELFNETFLGQSGADEIQPVPIFIVGLPRSGSTLIEQILASHSTVEGTHELSDLSKVVRTMRQRSRRDQRFPEVVASLRSGGWARIGTHYIERTAKHRFGAPFFIDKNPNNFVFIGLLKLAIPNAKIINARRHPLDSCLGSFKQLFASGQPFSYDSTELADYYVQYQRLMDHWHRVLPGFVLDVHYENVVADLETEVRRILEFCGLPFERECLNFHKTIRAVKTASSEQVRQPIYSTSVYLWKNYEKHLGPMIEILGPLLSELPENLQPMNLLQLKQ